MVVNETSDTHSFDITNLPLCSIHPFHHVREVMFSYLY